MAFPSEPVDLVTAISVSISAFDPLDPWLSQSNYDEHYWDEEAEMVASGAATALTKAEIYDQLAAALGPLIRSASEDDYVRERLEAIAGAVWSWLELHPEARAKD